MGNWLCKNGEECIPPDLTTETENSVAVHNSTLIFLHGLGDTGRDWLTLLKRLVPSGCKVICPNARIIQVALNNNTSMPAWYNIYGMTIDAPQDEIGIMTAVEDVDALVEAEINAGISPERILVGGFSQGGSVALYYGLTSGKHIAGVLLLSSWLPLAKQLTQNYSLIKTRSDLPILLCHGTSDTVIPSFMSVLTHKFLQNFQLQQSVIKIFSDLGHAYNEEELLFAKAFIQRILPD